MATKSADLPRRKEPMRSSSFKALAPFKVAIRSAMGAGSAVALPLAPLASRGGTHLARHIEIVVARRAIRTQSDVDPGPHQRLDRTKAARELEVGFRAVEDLRAGRGEDIYLLGLQLRHVHRQQARRQQVQAFQPR